MRIHVVQTGDTLWQIAQQYRTEVNQIIWLNELENPDRLVVGQSLVIPESGREYVIQPGDNLWTIARMFGVTVQELTTANTITDPARIYAGQMLTNPYETHIVQAGDYIWYIAQRYGVTAESIIAANDIGEPGLIFPGQVLRIPLLNQPVIDVNAYISRLNEQGIAEVQRLGRNFTYLSPFMYTFTEDGMLTELQEQPVLEAARANGAAPLLVVNNFSQNKFSPDLAAAILRNPSSQETLIINLLEKMNEKGYAGVNFNFESVFPEDRDNYNTFLQRVVDRIRPEGFLISTALAPKDSADQQGLLYEAHDYQVHGEIVDFVVLMTYEWGYSGGRPWAIAPINEVREVLDYAVTVIPPAKILMGMPLYGRVWDIPWVEGTSATTVSPKAAVKMAANYGVAIQYDETYQSPFFRYVDESGQGHEVWFEDARSVQAKYNTVKEYDIRGVSYWVLGNPFPQNWAVLQSNFSIRKL